MLHTLQNLLSLCCLAMVFKMIWIVFHVPTVSISFVSFVPFCKKNTKSNNRNAHKRISILFWDIYVEIKFVTVSFNSKYYFCTYLLASLKFAQLILYIHLYLSNWPFFEKKHYKFYYLSLRIYFQFGNVFNHHSGQYDSL